MSVKDFFNNTFKSLQSNSLPLSNIIFISLACIGILACIISSYLKKNIGTAFLVGYCLTFFSIGFVFLLSPNFNYLSLLLPLFLTIAIGGIIYQTDHGAFHNQCALYVDPDPDIQMNMNELKSRWANFA